MSHRGDDLNKGCMAFNVTFNDEMEADYEIWRYSFLKPTIYPLSKLPHRISFI